MSSSSNQKRRKWYQQTSFGDCRAFHRPDAFIPRNQGVQAPVAKTYKIEDSNRCTTFKRTIKHNHGKT